MEADVLLWLTFGASAAAIAISTATLIICYAARRRMRNQLLQEAARGNY